MRTVEILGNGYFAQKIKVNDLELISPDPQHLAKSFSSILTDEFSPKTTREEKFRINVPRNTDNEYQSMLNSAEFKQNPLVVKQNLS